MRSFLKISLMAALVWLAGGIAAIVPDGDAHAASAPSLLAPVDADVIDGVVTAQDGQQVDVATKAPGNASARAEEIVVRGLDERISSWKKAETDHAILYSNGSESKLRQAAMDVERLHYLMSFIFGQDEASDDIQKVQIFLVGDSDFMDSLRLTNWRSAEGPFSGPVQKQRYYDPRMTGAVMAVSRADLYFSANNGASARDVSNFLANAGGGGFEEGSFDEDGFGESGFNDDPGPPDFVDDSGGDQERPWEQALFAGYAQHYITSYLPAAYPRWYVDAIGALFSTIRVNDKGDLEYGRSPPAFRGLYNNSKPADLAMLLRDGSAGETAVWSLHQAWLTAHFFFLATSNQDRKKQLAQYMGAIATGHSPHAAAAVFGDLERLQDEIKDYGNARTRYARVPLPADLQADPIISPLGVTEASFLEAVLQLESRLTLPALPNANTPIDEAKAMRRDHERAAKARDQWMVDLRKDTDMATARIGALLVLAEAECRIGNFDACILAADSALVQSPNDHRAVGWKAIALVNQAASAPPSLRADRVAAARALALAANKSDPDALMPLLAYFRSFTDSGETAPEDALVAMLKIIQSTPNAPEPRLLLARELLRQSRDEVAKVIMLPLVNGAWDSPERQQASAEISAAGF